MNNRPTRFQAVLLLLFFALYFYRAGAGNLEGLLNYPFWRDMGAAISNEAFIALRNEHLWKVFPLLVGPFVALIAVTALLARTGAPPVPRWLFLGALALQLVALVSTIFIQLPIQFQLNQTGFNVSAIDRLIVTDLWLRRVPSLIEGAFVVVALWHVIARDRQISSVSRP